MSRVAVLVNPAYPARAELQVRETESAGRAMGLQIQIFSAGTGREINTVFASLARERPDALFVNPDPFFVARRVQLATLAARHAIPTSFSTRRRSGSRCFAKNYPDVKRFTHRAFPHPSDRLSCEDRHHDAACF